MAGETRSGAGTVTERLEHWAAVQPDKRLWTFLDVDGQERDAYTYQSFLERTTALASYLSETAGLKNGDRVLLVYPPGLEIIAAFYACARIGVIAVPVYPPTPMAFEAGLAKLAFIARDCAAGAALTTRGFYRSYRLLLAKRKFASLWQDIPALPQLDWVTTDDARSPRAATARHDPNPTLFLQYTSGSTSDPKGVIVSHANVLANAHATLQHCPTGVSWLPQYHDMGFIGYYMYPMITGGTTWGFSPLDFLKRPALWFETMSRVKATIVSAPNFAYDYCLREDKLPESALRGIDLSSILVMMNAAEPVRADTFVRFRDRFEAYGLKPEAYMNAYGLAENTLAVSLHGKHVLTVNKQFLQQRKLHVEKTDLRNANQSRLVSCGKPLDGVEVRIVDPDTREALGEERIGEIWLAGPSKCAGYWNREELSREVFGATIEGDASGKTYLRTGDLGFVREGEIHVCGRVKDLIIVRGVNYYPQDIEAIVEAASPEIRKGCTAAFSVDLDGEALVVVAEVKDEKRPPDPAPIAHAIRTQYYIEPHTIAFIVRRSIPKTTSGKIARNRVREAWLRNELPVIRAHARVRAASGPDLAGLRERFRYIVELYNLTGDEEFTFAEIGIDSLTMVNLLEDIKDLMVEHGAESLIDQVDIRLLQKLTVAQFFGLLDQFEQGPQEPLPALANLLRIVHEEFDAHERECMRADAELGLPAADDGRPQEPVTSVLLTGATGFFGPFLLSSLLRKTSHAYHVLIRATDPVHGRDRIRAALKRARIWTPELDAEVEARVRVVCGDLVRPRLGLTARHWDALAEQVQAVCHNGALVNYVLSYEALRPHNVDGTRELIRFAFDRRKKEFHLVSSTFIYGWSTKRVLWESDANPDMANLDFGYAQSKWVAEQLALAAEKQGLDVRIYRPSLISASRGGVGSRDDIAIRLIAFMIRHGVAVEALNQISFLPADIVADNIAAIFGLPRGEANTYHVTVDEYYNLADVTRAMTRLYGYRFEYYDIPQFIEKMNELCTKDDLLYPLLDFFNRSYGKIEAMRDKRYNNERYRQARQEAGSVEGDPPLDMTVSFIVEYMRREGILDEARWRAESRGGTDAGSPAAKARPGG